MKLIRFTILTFSFLAIYSCNNKHAKINKLAVPDGISINAHTTKTIIVNTDSLHLKNYKIALKLFGNQDNEYFDNNTELTVIQNGKTVIRDSLITNGNEISYKDFNGDNNNDLLIKHTSSARSNIAYYLYLTDTINNTLTRVNDFENILNPEYNPENNTIESYVVSGKDYLYFYHIVNDKALSYNIAIEDNHEENNDFEKDYNEALKKIQTLNK